jgi:hypothetical protein
MMKRKPKKTAEPVLSAMQEIEGLLVGIGTRFDDLKRKIFDAERKVEWCNQTVRHMRSSGLERFEDLENRVRLMEMNIRVVRRAQFEKQE